MPKLVFTGGGTAGHVMPNLALLPALQQLGVKVEYIGSVRGMEKDLAEQAVLPYHAIATGKLRRYVDLQNFLDLFRIPLGLWQAWRLLGKIRPDLIFSKGGFVSVPVVIGGHLRGIPVILHESDLTPGLANRICAPFAQKICVCFSQTLKYLPVKKAVLTGSPVRAQLMEGDRAQGFLLTGFLAKPDLPVLLVMGGSSGSKAVNAALRGQLATLAKSFRIIHLCGKGNVDDTLQKPNQYQQFAFVQEELPHLLAITDFVLSRAGANALFELLALRIPHLLIPLSRAVSRGDQILNAEAFEKEGFSLVLSEEELQAHPELLSQKLSLLQSDQEKFRAKMRDSKVSHGIVNVMEEIKKELLSLGAL